ncbi:MAG: EthD domain-containing protein [Pseudomonadales bacterium]
MIRTLMFLSHTSHDDPFAHRGAIALELLARICPDAVGYTQTRALSTQLEPDQAPHFAGVAEFRFVDPGAALELAASSASIAPLLAPEARIAAVVTGVDHVVMRLPNHCVTPGIKGVYPFRGLASLDAKAFSERWLYGHGPIAAATEEALCYVQCHLVAPGWSDGDPAFHAVTEIYWPDIAAARRAVGSRQMREDQGEDARDFLEPGSVRLVFAEEEVVRRV